MIWLAVLTLLPPSPQQGRDWPQFRGPGGLAIADDLPIPTAFGPDSNVLWKATVPSGHSSPCIVGTRVLLTGFEAGENVVLALDRKSGQSLWSSRFAGPPYPTYDHIDAAEVLSTPASDGERVVVYLANHGLVALDLEGKLLWEKRLPPPEFSFGVGTSPLLYDGLVVLSRDGTPEDGILAFDASDGTELWRIPRFGFGESHGTPFLWRHAEGEALVVGGNTRLCAYDPGTGDPIWSVDGLTAFPCTTPTADRDTLYFAAWSTPNATGRSFWEAAFGRSLELTDGEIADTRMLFKRLDRNGDGRVPPEEVPECRAKDAFGVLDNDQSGAWEEAEFAGQTIPGNTPGKNLMVAVAHGGKGDVTKSHVRWSSERGLPYVSSPLVYRGRAWLFQAGGLVTVLDAKTGVVQIDRERLSDRGEYYLSPVGAAGHVLAGSAEGTLYLLAADAKELTIEHTATFPEGLFATPAVLDGVVYLRTKTTMWAFGTPRKP